MASTEQTAAERQLIDELAGRLRLSGVEIEAAAASVGTVLGPAGEVQLLSWQSPPLAIVLRRELGLLRGLLPEPASLRQTLSVIDPLKTDWLAPHYPKLSSEETVALLEKGVRHATIGPELAAAFGSISYESPPLQRLRGIVARGPQITELLGMGTLEGHGEVYVALRVLGQAPDEKLRELLALAVRNEVGEEDQYLARQELLPLESSSEQQQETPREGTR